MDKIKAIEAEYTRSDLPAFDSGDTLRVYYKIIEGKTERVQVFEGLCIARKRSGGRKTFTVRKISYGVGVERIFPLASPRIQKSRSRATARCGGPSSTTSATAWARPPRSKS